MNAKQPRTTTPAATSRQRTEPPDTRTTTPDGEDHPEHADKRIGSNLRRLRIIGGFSQEELAERMRREGYRWNNLTVYNIERGERQLKLSEAQTILRCLGLDPIKDMPALLRDPLEGEFWTECRRARNLLAKYQQYGYELKLMRYRLGMLLFPEDKDGNRIPCALSPETCRAGYKTLYDLEVEWKGDQYAEEARGRLADGTDWYDAVAGMLERDAVSERRNGEFDDVLPPNADPDREETTTEEATHHDQ